MICVLHTFGRDLKWNPHIHMILCEEAVGNSNIWKKFNHINYKSLRRGWQYCILKLLLEKIQTPSFKALVDKLYIEHKEGFYVNAPPVKNFSSGVVNYIVRYAGRPVLAQSRITDYDGEFVSFTYTPHGTNELITETVSVYDFIKKLIIHIPDRDFKMIRYYGFYAVSSSRHKQYLQRAKRIESCMLGKYRAIYRSWRKCIFVSFRYDPLKCTCGTYMELLQIFSSEKAIVFYLSHYLHGDTS
jgi:hypothetical protein